MDIKSIVSNSVIYIPIICFVMALVSYNYYLIMLSVGILITFIIIIGLKLFFSQFSSNMFKRPRSNSEKCESAYFKIGNEQDMGFPSGHAQFIWFISTFLVLYNHYILKNNKYIYNFILVVVSILISISRLGIFQVLGGACHTPLQVIIGSLVGIVSANVYFKIVC